MNHINNVTVLVNGDSSKLSTWSNFPYFFTETLMSKGIQVNRIDISPNKTIQKIFEKTIYRFIVRLFRDTSYDYFRSCIHYIDAKIRIIKAVKKYPDSDVFIFMTFSFSTKSFAGRLSVQFCDWTYDHHIKHFNNRPPDFLERIAIKREDRELRKSDLQFVLFPWVAEYMKKRYSHNKINYLGYVVNSFHNPSIESLIPQKKSSYKILFIGNTKYINGANVLIKSSQILKQKYPGLTIHFIGLTEDKFNIEMPDYIKFYGYLNKDLIEDRSKFYNLLEEACLFVNTTPKWAAYSSMIEAMYFGTPVFVTQCDDNVKTFGSDINFGLYALENSEKHVISGIDNILSDPNYENLCRNAKKAVSEFGWPKYVDNMLQIMEDELEKKYDKV